MEQTAAVSIILTIYCRACFKSTDAAFIAYNYRIMRHIIRMYTHYTLVLWSVSKFAMSENVHTSHIPTYSLKLGVCVLTCWKQVVCIVEMGGTCMCCGNVGYVSVAEMGVCVVEMWGVYQLQKWGYNCMYCRNGGYVLWKCWGMYHILCILVVLYEYD